MREARSSDGFQTELVTYSDTWHQDVMDRATVYVRGVGAAEWAATPGGCSGPPLGWEVGRSILAQEQPTQGLVSTQPGNTNLTWDGMRRGTSPTPSTRGICLFIFCFLVSLLVTVRKQSRKG